MTSLLRRRGHRIESEAGQAYFRFNMAVAVLLASTLVWLAFPRIVGTRELACVAAYLAYAGLWTGLVSGGVGKADARQKAALILDHLVFCTCLAFSSRNFAVLAWVSVTTSVGHGLRFGQARGIAAALVGGACIFLATSLGPAWNLPLELALGLAATAVIAPIYVVRLARTIEAQRRDTEARAATLESALRIDGLTGILNRRGFEDAWRQLSDAAGLSTVAVGLVYLDLDGFKPVNDTYGHEAGDATLQQVAKLLSQSVRNTDSVARLGGDEFAILVRSPTCEADVQQVADKAVDAVRTWDWSAVGARLGASAGTVYVATGSSLGDAIREADERMFAVKRKRKSSSAR
jgi:diguanylate cyclase (GGDEF)-like protein